MNTPLQLLELVHAPSLHTHPTTTFSSMHVLGMMQLTIPPFPMRKNVYTGAGAPDLTAIEAPQEAHFSQDIATPSDDFCLVHQAKQGKPPPTPLSGFRGITLESQHPLHPRNLSKSMMVLYMSLLKSISSSDQPLCTQEAF